MDDIDLSVFDNLTQQKLKVLIYAIKHCSTDESKWAINELVTLIFKQSSDTPGRFLDFIKTHELSELEDLEKSKWSVLEKFQTEQITYLLEYICKSGRLSLLKYIQEVVGFNLIQRYFLSNCQSGAEEFLRPIISRCGSWHILLYIYDTVKPCFKYALKNFTSRDEVLNTMMNQVEATDEDVANSKYCELHDPDYPTTPPPEQ